MLDLVLARVVRRVILEIRVLCEGEHCGSTTARGAFEYRPEQIQSPVVKHWQDVLTLNVNLDFLPRRPYRLDSAAIPIGSRCGMRLTDHVQFIQFGILRYSYDFESRNVVQFREVTAERLYKFSVYRTPALMVSVTLDTVPGVSPWSPPSPTLMVPLTR